MSLGRRGQTENSEPRQRFSTTVFAARDRPNRHNDWFGTARGRIGWVANDWLFYGTGGFAWVNDKVDRTIVCVGGACPGASLVSPLVGQVSSDSGTATGWVAGGGIEWGIAPNWSVKAEYLHISVSADHAFTYTIATANRTQKTDLEIDTVQIGVNYHFNWGASVVARY